jgi:hypothetical protein
MTHRSYRGFVASPNFPLLGALRDKHFHAGNSLNAASRRHLKKLRGLGTIDDVKYQPAIQFVGFQRRPLLERMHSYWRRVHDCIKSHATERSSFHRFAAHCAREVLRSLVSPGSQENRRACSRKREGHRARGPSGSHDQYSAAAKLDAPFQGLQHAHIIRVVAVQFSAAPHYDGIHGPDFFGEGIASV